MSDMSAATKTRESVFRTKSQREFAARDELLNQGIAAEVPMELRWRKNHHRQKQAKPQEQPIMTAYVIVRERRESHRLLSALQRTRYVSRYVGSVQPEEMSRLHRLNGRKINEPAAAEPPKFSEGEAVIIPKGRHTGLPAKVVRVKGQSVEVEYVLLGQARRAIVGAYDLVRPPT